MCQINFVTVVLKGQIKYLLPTGLAHKEIIQYNEKFPCFLTLMFVFTYHYNIEFGLCFFFVNKSVCIYILFLTVVFKDHRAVHS